MVPFPDRLNVSGTSFRFLQKIRRVAWSGPQGSSDRDGVSRLKVAGSNPVSCSNKLWTLILGYQGFLSYGKVMSKQLTVNCPICRKKVQWNDNPHRPFCSERCRLLDLGQWADEGYRIPGRTPMADELDNLIKFPGVDDADPKE